MPFAGMDDQHAGLPRRRQHGGAGCNRYLEPRHVVAERRAEPAGFEKIALHVDDDERGAPSLRIGDPGPMGRILIRGEAGHDIIPELYPVAGEVVIDKPGKGAFFATDLDHILHQRGIRSLIVCGVTTEVCVNTTVREANDRGFRCIVLGDCCASYFPEFHDMGLKMIKAQGGIFGWVAASDDVIAALETTNVGVSRKYAQGGAL